MKRQIKFRAKTLANGHWVYGNLIKRSDDYVSIRNSKSEPWVDPETVGQFTGLTDRNGKEIYEGDIITVNSKYPRVVLWDKMCWALMPTEYFHDEMFWVMNLQHPGIDWWDEFADEFEVIGNIHDNPDLIPNQPTEV
ncbi:MAG: hypothetical protein HDS87_06955 [Bacteroidales bacterium]|nr:hypothetical protein [Bacteroidales bacterium]